jgi:epoxyqueuosine reductase
MNIKKIVKNNLLQNAGYLVGYSDLRGLLPAKYEGFDYAIVLARRLDDRIINNIADGPNIDYFDHYQEVNDELNLVARNLADAISSQGSKTLVIASTSHDKDLDDNYFQTLRTDFSHKMAATRAGLGWIGKTALFISKQFGPRMRLVTLLTDCPVPYCKEPMYESQCGSCDLCVRECPAHAANGKLWNIHIDRDEFFDAFACRKKARELSRNNFNKEISLCGRCIAVCPIGKKASAK